MDKNKIEEALQEYDVKEAVIAELRDEYNKLEINGLEDKKGLEMVHQARISIKTLRVRIEKKRQELKADALAYGRAIDGEATRLTGLLEPIEKTLAEKESVIMKEKQRIKEEAEREKERILQNKIDVISSYNYPVDVQILKIISDAEYTKLVTTAKRTFEEKQAQIEAEAKAKREEEERLEKQRLEQQAKAQELIEKQAKIDAEQQALEQARIKMEEQKKMEEIASLEKQTFLDLAAREQQRNDALEHATKEPAAQDHLKYGDLKNDSENLIRYADHLESVPFPVLNYQESQDILSVTTKHLRQIIRELRYNIGDPMRGSMRDLDGKLHI